MALSPLAAAAADAAALAELAEATTLDHVVSLEGKAVAAGAAPSLEPSLWNVAAWAWEEREFTPWARARLNELLAGVDVDVPSGHVRIVEVESVKGDASVNLRKVRARERESERARARAPAHTQHLCHGPRPTPRPHLPPQISVPERPALRAGDRAPPPSGALPARNQPTRAAPLLAAADEPIG